MIHETKARDWFDARERGQRLPCHEISDEQWCDLCGHRYVTHPSERAAFEASGFWICETCTEDLLS